MFTPELMNDLGIGIRTLHKDAMISDLNYEPVLFTTEDLIEAFALKNHCLRLIYLIEKYVWIAVVYRCLRSLKVIR